MSDDRDDEWSTPTRREGRRSSMRTMFEFRARAWLVWFLLIIALGILSYLIVLQLVPG